MIKRVMGLTLASILIAFPPIQSTAQIETAIEALKALSKGIWDEFNQQKVIDDLIAVTEAQQRRIVALEALIQRVDDLQRQINERALEIHVDENRSRVDLLDRIIRDTDGTVAELDAKIDLALVPSGTIAIFEKANCTSMPGWDDYHKATGKFILGVDYSDENKPAYPLGVPGGNAIVQLSLRELPTHNHTTHTDADERRFFTFTRHDQENKDFKDIKPQTPGRHEYHHSGATNSVGKGKPFNNMPPYVALRFCMKK